LPFHFRLSGEDENQDGCHGFHRPGQERAPDEQAEEKCAVSSVHKPCSSSLAVLNSDRDSVLSSIARWRRRFCS
jgi:hypothetical protein